MSRLVCSTAVILIALTLHGCGHKDSGPAPSTPTTTTNTATTTTTTTGPLPTPGSPGCVSTSTKLEPGPVPPPTPCPTPMHQAMVQAGDSQARQHNMAAAVAYAGPDGKGGYCSMGYVGYPPGAPGSTRSTVHGEFLYGSLTKPVVATTIMRMAEKGMLNLDDVAFPRMERVFHKATGGDSLTNHFGEQIKSVTIRQLMSMRGSIFDYDEMPEQKKKHEEDIGPSETIQMWAQRLTNPPGTCGMYSSMAYTLLGLVMMPDDIDQWDQLDENPFWKKNFPGLKFAMHGLCRKYTDVDGVCAACKANGINSILDISCTGGWTNGNLYGPPEEVARFFWSLFKGQLITDGSLRQMLDYKALGHQGATDGHTCSAPWCDGCWYGLGLQAPANSLDTERRIGNSCLSDFPGHAGEAYGFTTISAFDRARDAVYVGGIASDGAPYAGPIWGALHDAVNPTAVVDDTISI